MLFVFAGSDRKKVRDAVHVAREKLGARKERITVTDTHSLEDLDAAMRGGGMFAQERVVLFDGLLTGGEMRDRVLEQLASLKESSDIFFIVEEKLDVATKRALTKYAETIELFDAPKKEKDNAIFRMRYALEGGDKKALWVSLMREYASGKAPEAVHGFLFWAAKQIYLSGKNKTRGEKLLIALAELPHEARRKGFDLEYALERFVLSQM